MCHLNIYRLLLILFFITSGAMADTWTVDDDGKADFDNIQSAVDAASNGDEIIGAAWDVYGQWQLCCQYEWQRGFAEKSRRPTSHNSQRTESANRLLLRKWRNSTSTIISGFTITQGSRAVRVEVSDV